MPAFSDGEPVSRSPENALAGIVGRAKANVKNADLKNPMTETHLNLRGLKCPLPALKTRKALAGLAAGSVIIVECTDPLAAIDIPNLLNETQDILEGQGDQNGALIFRIRKSDRAGTRPDQK